MSNERLVVEAQPRSVTGKKVKQLRRDGIIPAVIYGQGEPEHIQVENGPLRRVLRVAGTTQLIDVQVGKSKKTVLTREIQQHVTRGDLIHVDFLEVDMKGTVTSDAGLVPVGVAGPQAEGLGIATLTAQTVQIEAAPDDLVSEIEIDMTLITKADSVIFVRDLIAPEGITILADPDTVLARFEVARAEVSAEDFGDGEGDGEGEGEGEEAAE